jgi:tetratricopeptide (TPR) repeat protein/predicted Ser/Thr protein kinase
MTEKGTDRVETLFYEAADLSPPEQRALLDAACSGEPGLRAAVEKLLAYDARLRAVSSAGTFLNSPLQHPPQPPTTSPAPAAGRTLPPRVGRYRIVRLLGEGGMGTVYEAEQDNPRRPVALKVVRAGLVSPALRKRFAQEAQILGRLHHPGIAQIYEAGVAEDDQPFFALEFIRGLPLDEYAQLQGLTAPARLELLARVCDAVQHAHDQGVIHRDLKPSNLLVDETGQPKVLDFGVARATDADLRATTDLTGTGQIVGTVSYMSPEQVAADPAALDARSDVYTLGVILFQLLAGRLPYPLEQLPLPGAAWVIREEQPARLGAIDTRLRGDVETVVAKSLEKDPARRYQSAAELAADIRRHLRREPIRARPPSPLYQLGKFTRRHKALVVTTVVFLGLLLVAGAIATWQAIRLAQAERDQTLEQARIGREVRDALTKAEVLREQARAADDPGKWAKAREADDPGKWAKAREVARRAEALAESGPVEPGLAERVAVLLRELKVEDENRQMVAELDRIRSQLAEVKGDSVDPRSTAGPSYAKAFRRYGVDVEGLPVAEAARRVRESAIREALLTALDHWAWYQEKSPGQAKLWAVADGADDDPWRRRLREAAVRKDPARLKELAGETRALEQPPAALALLGDALHVVGLPGEAAVLLRQAQLRHPDDFWTNHNLGYVLAYKTNPPRPEEALGYFRAALALRPRSPGVHFGVGLALRAQGKLPEAAACFRRALEFDPNFFSAHANLGEVLRALGDLDGAEACHRKALELHPKDPRSYNHLGATLQYQGELPEAAACFRRCLALNPKNALAHYNLGTVLLFQGNLSEAASSYRSALRIDAKFATAHCNLGHVLFRQGELHAALAELKTGHDLGSRLRGWSNPSAEWVKQCERMLELDGRLPSIRKGEGRPASPAERLELADLCRYKRLYGTSVLFFTEALAADANLASDFRATNRYRAACAAVLLDSGQGTEAPPPDEAGRARLRRQALEWLRADLALWQGQLRETRPAERARLRLAVHSWQADPALAAVRDAGALAALPPAERQAWQQLWADVASTLAKARERK